MSAEIINVERFNHGTGGIYKITGADEKQVNDKALEVKQTIDYYQSPVLTKAMKVKDNWQAEIKYYGLD